MQFLLKKKKSQKDDTRATHFCESQYEYFPRFLKHFLLFAVHLALPISGLWAAKLKSH